MVRGSWRSWRRTRAAVARVRAAEKAVGRAEVGGDLGGGGEQAGAPGPPVRVGVEQAGAVLLARVQDVPGAGLDGHREAQFREASGDAGGAGGEAGGERVVVHVVEGQSHAVVAEAGEEGEGVVEAEVGEAVGAIAEAERGGGGGHVALTFFPARRASGTSARVASAPPRAPARAERAAWRGIMARMPPPTARWVSGGEGLSAACR